MSRILWLLSIVSLAIAFQYPFVSLNFDEYSRYYSENEKDVGDPVYVDVAQGTIMGQVKSNSNYSYNSFEGIPYGKPPTGAMRFKDAEPADPWEGILNATRKPHSCPQVFPNFPGTQNEDCLYLNVFTPVDHLEQPEPLPVMVFIHGGGFALGSSSMYDGAQPLVERNVILVTINYRLGVLGFLSTEDAAAPGNQGLKDQTLSLRWVQDNIAAFNGDPARVTVFGESAGGGAVHYQVLTPYAEGLFSGAIMQSGQAFAPWSRGRDFLRLAQDVGSRFNCTTDDTDALVSCLQEQDYSMIATLYTEYIEWNYQPFYFAPRIDGDYIPDDPVTLVKEGRYNHVPVMMGLNKHEGALVSGDLYWFTNLIDSLVENFTENAQPSLELYDDEDPLNTATTAYNYYLGGLNFEFEDADNVTNIYSDRFFTVPVDWLNQLIADVDVVYTCELEHRGERGLMDLYLGLNDTLAKRWISHGDELQYLFNPIIIGNPTNAEDTIVKELYLTMWANFAKTRNPTPDDSLGFIWERTNSADLRHLVITANLPLTMRTDQRATQRAFWESLPLRINDLLRP